MIIWDKTERAYKDLPLEEAAGGLTSGAYLPQNRSISVLGPDGGSDVYESPPREIASYLQKGFKLASPDQVLAYEAQDQVPTSFALGVGDMFGANPITQALESRGMVQRGTSDRFRAIRQENPIANAAGKMAGMAATMGGGLLSGTVGATAGAIEAAGAAAGRYSITRFGGGAATAAARLMTGAGETGMAAQATRMAGASARLGTEGAAYGAIDGLSEADFGDPKIAGSQILASVGTHALYGAALGMVGGAALKGLTATPKAIGGLYEMATGAAGKLEKFRIKRFEKLAPDDALAGKIDTATGRAEVLGPDVVSGHTTAISDAMDASKAAMDDMLADGLEGATLKKGAVHLPKNRPFQQAKAFEATKDFAAKTWAAGEKMGGPAGERLQAIGDDIFAKATDYPKALDALAQARLALGRVPGKLGKKDSAAVQTAVDSVDYMITDASLWGSEAAQAMTGHLTTTQRAIQVGKATEEAFMVPTEAGGMATNREQMGKWLDAYTDPKMDTTGLSITEQVNSNLEYFAHLRDNFNLSKSSVGKLRTLAATALKLKKTFGSASEKLTARNQVRDMDAAMSGSAMSQMFSEQSMSGFGVGIGMGAVLNPVAAAKAMAGKTVAGKLWKGIESVYNPAGYYIRKAQLESARQETASHIRTKVSQAIKAIKGSKITIDPPPMARRMASPALFSLIGATNSEKRSTAQKEAVQELERITADPTVVADTVSQNLGQTADEMPNITNAIALKIVTNAQWMLQNNMPGQASPTLFGKPAALSDFELQKFEQQLTISQDPLHAVDLLAKGQLTQADMQALKGMWPEIYEQWHTEVMDQMGDMADPNDVPYATRIQLGIMFDIALDPSMQFDQIILAQEANAAMMMQGQGDQPQGPTNGPALMSDGLQSKSQESIMQGSTDMDQTANRRTQ